MEEVFCLIIVWVVWCVEVRMYGVLFVIVQGGVDSVL